MSSSSDEAALLTFSVICLFYSAAIGAGAVYAYKVKESKASLAAGGSASVCLFITTLVTFFLPKRVEAWGCLAIITAGLMVLGLVRWRLFPGEDGQKKFIPMGMVAVLSGVVLLIQLIALIVIEA
ncbi:hypothetical protein CTAYLR_000797 [Chrysophaeum taylorii]|uniref:Uncharacterized protein n=1 Tax=Chrysophaeum taylorii TaxID=2483200 RepID=A0AAD7XS56_9STRA|nr:hypothetical protein CTAYLR_000797 [Chrysophaeum taylorii]